jgi:hypothetical protein
VVKSRGQGRGIEAVLQKNNILHNFFSYAMMAELKIPLKIEMGMRPLTILRTLGSCGLRVRLPKPTLIVLAGVRHQEPKP